MNTLKLCMLAPEFYPCWGGVGVNIVDIVRRLPKDIEIHVIAAKRGNYSEEEISETIGLTDNVNLSFISSAEETFLYNAVFQYKCLKHVRQLIKKHDINIIQSHMAQIPDVLLRFVIDTPIVTYIHSTIRWQFKGIIKSLQNGELESSEKWTLALYPLLDVINKAYFLRKNNSYYITESSFMKSLVKKEYGAEITTIISNSIDVGQVQSYMNNGSEFAEKFKSKQVVLYAGRLVNYKGVGLFVESIPQIISRVEDKNSLVFVFAGPGNIDGYLKQLKQLNIPSKNWLFTGALPREQLVHLMSVASCVVVPSFIDNIPNVVLESMACGVPVIASRVGGIPEAVVHGWNGFLVQPGDINQFAKRIVQLLNDRDLAKKMGQNGVKTIKSKFCWDVNISKYVNLYNSIVT